MDAAATAAKVTLTIRSDVSHQFGRHSCSGDGNRIGSGSFGAKDGIGAG